MAADAAAERLERLLEAPALGRDELVQFVALHLEVVDSLLDPSVVGAAVASLLDSSVVEAKEVVV